MMIQKAEIQLTDHGQGKVYIDGNEVGGVTELTFSAGVGQVNTLTVTRISKEMRAEIGPAILNLKLIDNDRCMDFFEWRRFGWPK